MSLKYSISDSMYKTKKIGNIIGDQPKLEDDWNKIDVGVV